jgi:meso-butanediol dehydrogenase / (S,S)-butanediol dehydrogenase / diacetyl reductase
MNDASRSASAAVRTQANEGRLDGKVALVTGAGQGIGAAVAARLSDDGARVVVADIDIATAKSVAESIANRGGTAFPAAMDVTIDGDRRRLIDAAIKRWGTIDILVNNAGIYVARPVLELSLDEWRRVFEVNAEGVFFMAQAALGVMVKKQYGRIINLSSTAAYTGTATMIAYNASKAAVLAITRSLAREYASLGVTVNSVLPGVVGTPMWDSLNEEVGPMLGFAPGALLADRVSRIPAGRPGSPEEVAAVVSFLASRESSYVTGQAINVCGGQFML